MQGVVGDYLTRNHVPGTSAADLLTTYKSFGPDPFVAPTKDGAAFSAWAYAAARCEEICTS
ncbi:MAG: hypothetical protein HYX94_13250 [Chloroflexi bacterium]|nr:hypothetical protein [Chloroflexota bacterium]